MLSLSAVLDFSTDFGFGSLPNSLPKKSETPSAMATWIMARKTRMARRRKFVERIR